VTPHLKAKQGDYADAILLPGDPLRAKWIAETFFEAPRLVNDVRSCFGYTGRYKGKPISVQATGMGQPSVAIYVNELISVYGAKVLIRAGTCGSLSAQLKARDLVLAMTACTDSGMNRTTFGAYDFAPPADFVLLRDAAALADARGLPHHVGNMLSSDVFYHKDWRAAYGVLVEHGVLAVEMETSTLYTLAARFGVRALSVCAISDNLVTGEVITPDERQSTLTDLARLVLDVAVSDAGKG
jgi:purine-nucleoside phosphorylase